MAGQFSGVNGHATVIAATPNLPIPSQHSQGGTSTASSRRSLHKYESISLSTTTLTASILLVD